MKSKSLTLQSLADLRRNLIDKKDRARTRFEAGAHFRAELAAHVLRSEESVEINADIARVAYHTMYQEYYHSSYAVTKLEERSHVWERLADACKLAQLTPRAYLYPLFSFYHSSFGRPPKHFELTTETAIAKVRRFYNLPEELSECASVSAKTNVPASQSAPKVAASSIYVPVPKSELFSLAEKQMQRVMKAQRMSREQVYRDLVLTGDLYFPPHYLKHDPTYQRVVSEQH